MGVTLDDKTEHCLQFIIEQAEGCQRKPLSVNDAKPLFVGLNGAQGVGKTTLVGRLNFISVKASPFRFVLPSFE